MNRLTPHRKRAISEEKQDESRKRCKESGENHSQSPSSRKVKPQSKTATSAPTSSTSSSKSKAASSLMSASSLTSTSSSDSASSCADESELSVAALKKKFKQAQTLAEAWEAEVERNYSEDDAFAIDGFLTRYTNEYLGHVNDRTSYATAIAEDPDGRLRAEALRGWVYFKEIERLDAAYPHIGGLL